MTCQTNKKNTCADRDIPPFELADVMDAGAVQTLMDDFYCLTNIGVGIIDIKGEILVATGWQEICTRFHRVHPETCKNCLESDIHLAEDVEPGTFKLYRCKNHMWDMATPLIVGGSYLGSLYLGQFLFNDEHIDIDFFSQQARRYGFDETEYLAALESVPRWSRETVTSAMTFYTKLAGLISNLSYSNIKLGHSIKQQNYLLVALQRSEEKYRDLVENLNDVVFTLNKKGIITYASPVTEKITGYSPEELVGSPFQRIIHPDDLVTLNSRFKEVLMGNLSPFEYRYSRKDGEIRWARSSSRPNNNGNQVVEIVGVFSDITEQKQAEEATRHALQEKEILLRELYHRTKNNMQVISSMLELEMDYAPSAEVQSVLLGINNRIKSMSLVHQKLYEAQDLSQIRLGEYLQELANILLQSYHLTPQQIDFQFELHPVKATIDIAIPCGLVLSELVSNTLKYAFPEHQAGVIRLKLTTRQPDWIDIRYQDNGVGVPPGFDYRNQQTLGLQTIGALVEHQLQGEVKFSSQKGFTCQFSFCNQYSRRV